MHKDYIFPKKSDFTKISISDVNIELPELKDISENYYSMQENQYRII